MWISSISFLPPVLTLVTSPCTVAHCGITTSPFTTTAFATYKPIDCPGLAVAAASGSVRATTTSVPTGAGYAGPTHPLFQPLQVSPSGSPQPDFRSVLTGARVFRQTAVRRKAVLKVRAAAGESVRGHHRRSWRPDWGRAYLFIWLWLVARMRV